MAFLFAVENTPFSIALMLMLFIALFEGVATVLGVGVSAFLDSLLPDLDLSIDGAEMPQGTVSRLLGWLLVGKVPAIMLLILLLTTFGILGLTVQYLILGLAGLSISGWLLSPLVLFASLPVVRFFAARLARYVGADTSQVVEVGDLVGCVGVITVGEAKADFPAQARVKDRFGTQHYVMVVPDEPNSRYRQGESVLLVQYHGQHFSVITPSSSLLNEMESQ
ncbi:OB-fold-containig protein [Ferrimonas kyonanensis]|uniref:OB-fold-containig protein n=1 Tax=Ferrimonas kyonanensis TaxID=364763 RepID=UPI0004189B2C|nr:OB-fold-containig protein [Ferrimonas kyonanensis]